MSAHAPNVLIPALDQARGVGVFSRLEQLYQELPATTCQRKNLCCNLLPPAHAIEIAAWLEGLRSLSSKERSAQAQSLMAYFLGNACERLACPWSTGDACAIYAKRFLGCRAYGLWSPEAYAQRRQAAIKGQELVKKAWAGLGVELPDEVFDLEHEYCGQVRTIQGAMPDDAALNALEAEIASLGADLDIVKMLADYGGDPAFVVAALSLGQQQALATKLGYTKEKLAGNDDQASEIMAKAKLAARRWALGW